MLVISGLHTHHLLERDNSLYITPARLIRGFCLHSTGFHASSSTWVSSKQGAPVNAHACLPSGRFLSVSESMILEWPRCEACGNDVRPPVLANPLGILSFSPRRTDFFSRLNSRSFSVLRQQSAVLTFFPHWLCASI